MYYVDQDHRFCIVCVIYVVALYDAIRYCDKMYSFSTIIIVKGLCIIIALLLHSLVGSEPKFHICGMFTTRSEPS